MTKLFCNSCDEQYNDTPLTDDLLFGLCAECGQLGCPYHAYGLREHYGRLGDGCKEEDCDGRLISESDRDFLVEQEWSKV